MGEAMGRQKAHERDRALEQEVWAITMEEKSKGWLSGPFTETQLVEQLGPLFVVSRRFGIRQGTKVRVIDDFSESLVNRCFGASETIDLGGVDELAVLAKAMLDMVKPNGDVILKLADGPVKKGRLHESLDLVKAKKLVGRTLDLESAYKQFLIRQSSAWASVLLVDGPEGTDGASSKRLFRSEALPFGASASVYGFNRFARAIQRIGTRLFFLVWTNFFDDYPQLDIEAMGRDSKDTAERLIELLGLRVSQCEKKRMDFAQEFIALGVVVEMTKAMENMVIIKNKKDRVEALADTMKCTELHGVARRCTGLHGITRNRKS